MRPRHHSAQLFSSVDLFAQIEQIPNHPGDRSEHLPRAMDRLPGLARKVAHDDFGYLPARDPATRIDLVSDEIDPMPDLDSPGYLAPERAASAVDVMEGRSQKPA